MDRYHPDGDKTSVFTVFGYMAAKALLAVLKQCVDDLTRENVRKQAASLKGLTLPMLRASQSTLGRMIMPDHAAADAVA